MAQGKKHQKSLEGVRQLVESAETPEQRRRNGRSATERICAVAELVPLQVSAEASVVRTMLADIRPAAHGLTPKTWANLLSRFRKELRLADVIDPNYQGRAARHTAWSSLVQMLAGDKKLSNGLATFYNWCAAKGIVPDAVDDAAIKRFHAWLEHRTLCPRPRDIVRRTPQLWNKGREKFEAWPKQQLTPLSFRAPQRRLSWEDLTESFRADADAYLKMRAAPDIFEERANAPKKPLAISTVKAQSEHLRLAASVLVESGTPVEKVTSLAVLVEPDAFKTILRHYLDGANGQPNAFAICLAKTLIQVAYHYVDVPPEQITRLKKIAAKLPEIPFQLTDKNKALLEQFESDRVRAELLFLPERLIGEFNKGVNQGRLDFVKAQVAIAIEFELTIPLRPQNLSRLNWKRHFSEPDGPKGRLLLQIPKAEMKSRKDDFVAEVPDHVARRLRWYRRHILPRLNADPNGDLFVTKKGVRKHQETITIQITREIADYLGIHMTVHQFRHLAGYFYLEDNPEDTETVRALLGHAWSKTTRIYVGSESRRAGKVYNRFVLQKREELKLRQKRQRKPMRNKKKDETPCAS